MEPHKQGEVALALQRHVTLPWSQLGFAGPASSLAFTL